MNKKNIQKIIEHCLAESHCEIDVRYNEPMKEHTTFKVGGNADCWIKPDGDGFTSFCAELLKKSREDNIPVFILGGGANIVVSDKGVRGIVLDMSGWNGESVWTLCANEDELVLKSGTSIDEAVDTALAYGFKGLEFLAGMPGTIGGAVWMNARCYEKEMADVITWVEIICRENVVGAQESDYVIKRIMVDGKKGFEYKKSPFQDMDCLILSAALKLEKGDKEEILAAMEKNREDRQEKGHYLFPCAGSVFKNNRNHGKPTGQIIDELGLKGKKTGDAQIAPFHGNIVINTGNAKANDIHALVGEVAAIVKTKTGCILEPEILFVGDWD
jgi:UDP-N-acetylmuramate dehydrogenase